MSETPYTAAEFTGAISKALAAKDVQAASDLIWFMAVYHPNEASDLRDLILLVTEAKP